MKPCLKYGPGGLYRLIQRGPIFFRLRFWSQQSICKAKITVKTALENALGRWHVGDNSLSISLTQFFLWLRNWSLWIRWRSIQWLGILHRFVSPFLHLRIYLIIIYVSLNIWYFIFWVIMWYCFIYLLKFLQLWPLEALSVGSCALWYIPINLGFSFLKLSYFLALLYAPSSSCIFPVSGLELDISPRKTASFYWRVVLETKTSALCVLLLRECCFF